MTDKELREEIEQVLRNLVLEFMELNHNKSDKASADELFSRTTNMSIQKVMDWLTSGDGLSDEAIQGIIEKEAGDKIGVDTRLIDDETLFMLCSAIASAATRIGRERIFKRGDEYCPHRDNDFPCPDNVPDELRLKKKDCLDCRQQLKQEKKDG